MTVVVNKREAMIRYLSSTNAKSDREYPIHIHTHTDLVLIRQARDNYHRKRNSLSQNEISL